MPSAVIHRLMTQERIVQGCRQPAGSPASLLARAMANEIRDRDLAASPSAGEAVAAVTAHLGTAGPAGVVDACFAAAGERVSRIVQGVAAALPATDDQASIRRAGRQLLARWPLHDGPDMFRRALVASLVPQVAHWPTLRALVHAAPMEVRAVPAPYIVHATLACGVATVAKHLANHAPAAALEGWIDRCYAMSGDGTLGGAMPEGSSAPAVLDVSGVLEALAPRLHGLTDHGVMATALAAMRDPVSLLPEGPVGGAAPSLESEIMREVVTAARSSSDLLYRLWHLVQDHLAPPGGTAAEASFRSVS